MMLQVLVIPKRAISTVTTPPVNYLLWEYLIPETQISLTGKLKKNADKGNVIKIKVLCFSHCVAVASRGPN